MNLRQIAPDTFEGAYRGHLVQIRRLGRANWAAWIDGQVEHFESLARARRECQRVIDYAE